MNRAAIMRWMFKFGQITSYVGWPFLVFMGLWRLENHYEEIKHDPEVILALKLISPWYGQECDVSQP